jgi:hypothetical protein
MANGNQPHRRSSCRFALPWQAPPIASMNERSCSRCLPTSGMPRRPSPLQRWRATSTLT